MGVRGFNKVLQEEGWLPDEAGTPCCSTSLWRDPSVMHNCPRFASRVSQIKRRSTLYIDGAGFAFHVHRIAYARHVNQVLNRKESTSARSSSALSSGRRSSTNNNCSCSTKHLTPEQVTRLLPNLIPLILLDEVTREFVETLQKKHHMKLIVVFDGGKRRKAKAKPNDHASDTDQEQPSEPLQWTAKAKTEQNRKQKRPAEWSAFQQYCCNGIMPSVDRVCQWESMFPKNRLFLTQVKFTLKLLNVQTMFCEEEADAEIARLVATTPNAYVVGNDSDFCFFPKARYIPVSTLEADGSVVTGSIISRRELVQTMQLPDEAAMVELAILLGNDYVGCSPNDTFDYTGQRKANDIMDHLRSEGKGYRVQSINGEETATAINFARKFYGLQSLDEEFLLISGAEAAEAREKLAEDEPEETRDLTMKLPRNFPIELSVVQTGDTNLKASIVRSLRAYLDEHLDDTEEGEKGVLDEIHIRALNQMSSPRPDNANNSFRPAWEDVPACYLIESCIAYTLRRSAASPLALMSPPCKLFECYKFHQTLYQLRHPNPGQTNLPSRGKRPESKSESEAQQGSGDGRSVRSGHMKKIEAPIKLPIDEHEGRIMSQINNNRVTIIQGETGCGKSTRVPIMVMKGATPDDPALSEVRLFISQPRRIAAKSLVERLRVTEPEFGKAIALRMGHGVREYQSSSTRAVFCTTGYLVRVLANHPEVFDRVSHLIIDEVHERSVDTDVLCLLCRRLLQSNPYIRLVLMSATLAAKLYQEYFDIAEPPIKVGARRFPIDEVFVEELPHHLRLPPKLIQSVKHLESECTKSKCITAPSNSAMEHLYSLAARVAISVGQPGSSVLIFVPGMKDIESISEKIDETYIPGRSFVCIPIHSDVPFEDQMTVFDETDDVKIIIATNAAESSLTIPDCDHVICTGLQKQITYNADSHRQMLSPCWISRASAQQRSGRVGRVRPGTVYRLYTREAYDSFMKEFESGEMLRMPLDSVILMLKEILKDEPTTPALLKCLEPPDLSSIERSYESLYRSNFISQPGDDGMITTLGAFVSALGIDLSLGQLIGLGIQFGVGPEAIELAAVLSFPKSPWLMSNAVVHAPGSFNNGSSKTFASKNVFDAGLYSEPLVAGDKAKRFLQLSWHPSNANKSKLIDPMYLLLDLFERSVLVNSYHSHQLLQRLVSTRDNLLGRVADFKKMDPSLLRVRVPPSKLNRSKLTVLRILQVWVSAEIIEYKALPFKHTTMKDGSFVVPIKTTGGVELQQSHLDFLRKNHLYRIETRAEVEQTGGIVPAGDEPFDIVHFLEAGFEDRLVSYAADTELDLCWYFYENGLQLYASSSFSQTSDFENLRKLWVDFSDESELHLKQLDPSARRGRGERASGRWVIQDKPERVADDSTSIVVKKYIIPDCGLAEGINNMIRTGLTKSSCEIRRAMSLDLTRNLMSKKKKKGGRNVVFQIFYCGGQIQKLTDTDLCDLFAISKRSGSYRISGKGESRSQSIVFDSPDHNNTQSRDNGEKNLRAKKPLLRNAPEGARLLSILAGSRRREATVQIPLPVAEGEDESEEEELISFSLGNGLAKIHQRWTRINSDKAVFASEFNSVPASVIPIENCSGTLYACCANTLELRGGSVKVEGLSLLPPGSHFLLLSLLSFHRTPDGLGSIPDNEEDLDDFIAHAISWANLKDQDGFTGDSDDAPDAAVDLGSRLKMSLQFSRACDDPDSQLICYPERVKELCRLFDGVDGNKVRAWPKLDSDPFVPKPEHEQQFIASLLAEMRHPSSFYEGYNSENASDHCFEDDCQQHIQDDSVLTSIPRRESDVMQTQSFSLDVPAEDNEYGKEEKNEDESRALHSEEVRVFSEAFLAKSLTMFAPIIPTNDADEMPTTNIMALFAKQVVDGLLFDAVWKQDNRDELVLAADLVGGTIKMCRDHWEVRHFVDQDNKSWYQALFVSKTLIPLKNRAFRESPKWYRYGRPWIMEQALACIPPACRDSFVMKQAEVRDEDDSKMKAILCNDIESAMRAEAAFFLERQFWVDRQHWWEQPFQELMQQLLKKILPAEQILKLANT